MAKPHKFAWNGIDVETTLSFEQLANMAQRAAQECTGDLLHGKQRIASTRSSERQIEFRITDFLITFKKYLVFHLDFEPRSGRTWMSSRIDWYVATRPTVGGFIPVATKTMVGHHTYLEFVHHLATQVNSADPHARVNIREGVAVSGAAAGNDSAGRGLKTSVPDPVAVGPVTAAPDPGDVTTAASLSQQAPVPSLEPALRPLVVPPRSGESSATDDVPALPALVTSVPGMPRRDRLRWEAPVQQPAARPSGSVKGYASLAEQLFAEDDSLFHTRLAQQGDAAMPWSLRLPDGQLLPFEMATVLGRNPVAPVGSAARPMPVADPNRSVSKTHALLELRQGLPWVTDLYSTNGTTLTNEVGEAVVCEPAVPVPVGDGWLVGLGEYSVGIVRRADG